MSQGKLTTDESSFERVYPEGVAGANCISGAELDGPVIDGVELLGDVPRAFKNGDSAVAAE